MDPESLAALQMGVPCWSPTVAQVSLDGYLLVDPASMAALQIFQEERHPSMMGIGQPKEGFSVFGMLNRCVGAPGRRLLKLWFLRPLLDLQACRRPLAFSHRKARCLMHP